MQEYVLLKDNKYISDISSEQKEGYIQIQVPASKIKTFVEYPFTCWCEQVNGSWVVHVPNESDTPGDDIDKMNDTIKQQQDTIDQLSNKFQQLDISTLQKSVNSLQDDANQNPIDGNKINSQIQALGQAIMNVQKSQSEVNASNTNQNTQSNTTNNNQSNNNQSK